MHRNSVRPSVLSTEFRKIVSNQVDDSVNITLILTPNLSVQEILPLYAPCMEYAHLMPGYVDDSDQPPSWVHDWDESTTFYVYFNAL